MLVPIGYFLFFHPLTQPGICQTENLVSKIKYSLKRDSEEQGVAPTSGEREKGE